jgi:CRP-like cAMP-binding protein
MVVVALRVFSLGSSGVGVFNAAAGVGALVAFPLTATLIGRPRLGAPCALSFLLAGLSLGLVGVVPAAWEAIAAIAVWGLAMALADATSLSLLHRLLDADPLTRTIGVLESIKLGAEGVGALLAPALVALLGTRPALVAAAVPLPLAIVYSTPRLRRADLAASGRSRLVALLHGAGQLRRLDMATLEGVAARAVPLELEPGDVLIRENESGDRFYVIESGEIELSQSGYAIGCLGPGTGLGERALLRAAPRSATATARTRADVLAIDREAFLDAVTGRAPDADVPAAALARVVADPTARPLADVLGDISVLAEVAPERIQRLADGAGLERFGPGATVIQEGEAATALYVVLSGRALASIGARPIRELWPGDSFGEIAIMHGVPRTATVTAIEPLLACRVAADALLAAIEATG